MARRPARNRPARSATELHRARLELVDTEGPFLAIPPLKRVWPEGMPQLTDARKATLVEAGKDFESAWERHDRSSDSDSALDDYRSARDKWVETVLRDVAGWAESLTWAEVPGVAAQSPNRAVTVHAQAALCGGDGIGAIVHVIDPVDSLRDVPGDLWAANPVDRLETMLRESKVPIGIVTDGRWWGLVCAREGVMAASGVVDALTWTEEPRTRDPGTELLVPLLDPVCVRLRGSTWHQVQQSRPHASRGVSGQVDHPGQLLRTAPAVGDGLGGHVMPQVLVHAEHFDAIEPARVLLAALQLGLHVRPDRAPRDAQLPSDTAH